MDEVLSVVVYTAVIIGAFLSTWVGKTKSKEPYDIQKFLSSLVISSLLATATVNVGSLADQLMQVGYAGTIVAYVIAGFGVDQGLSRLDRKKTPK